MVFHYMGQNNKFAFGREWRAKFENHRFLFIILLRDSYITMSEETFKYFTTSYLYGLMTAC